MRPNRGFAVKAAHQPGQQDALLESATATRKDRANTVIAAASTSDRSDPTVQGAITRITFSSEDTGYTIAKMKVDQPSPFVKSRCKNGILTITGRFPDMAVGKKWQCSGSWVKHSVWGHQLVAATAEELRPSSNTDLVAYLCGGATKGVGPVTARNMVDQYGSAILDVLDSPDAAAKLKKVKGIGAATANKIKTEWDKRAGATSHALQMSDFNFTQGRLRFA